MQFLNCVSTEPSGAVPVIDIQSQGRTLRIKGKPPEVEDLWGDMPGPEFWKLKEREERLKVKEQERKAKEPKETWTDDESWLVYWDPGDGLFFKAIQEKGLARRSWRTKGRLDASILNMFNDEEYDVSWFDEQRRYIVEVNFQNEDGTLGSKCYTYLSEVEFCVGTTAIVKVGQNFKLVYVAHCRKYTEKAEAEALNKSRHTHLKWIKGGVRTQ